MAGIPGPGKTTPASLVTHLPGAPTHVPQPYYGLEPTLKEATVEIFLQSRALIQQT